MPLCSSVTHRKEQYRLASAATPLRQMAVDRRELSLCAWAATLPCPMVTAGTPLPTTPANLLEWVTSTGFNLLSPSQLGSPTLLSLWSPTSLRLYPPTPSSPPPPPPLLFSTRSSSNTPLLSFLLLHSQFLLRLPLCPTHQDINPPPKPRDQAKHYANNIREAINWRIACKVLILMHNLF